MLMMMDLIFTIITFSKQRESDRFSWFEYSMFWCTMSLHDCEINYIDIMVLFSGNEINISIYLIILNFKN